MHIYFSEDKKLPDEEAKNNESLAIKDQDLSLKTAETKPPQLAGTAQGFMITVCVFNCYIL